MSVFKDEINKTIIYGCFPNEELVSPEITEKHPVDLGYYKDEGLDIIRKHWSDAKGLLAVGEKRIKVFRNNSEFENGSVVNVLINTGFDYGDLNENNPTYEQSVALKPVVTELDYIIWYAAISSYDSRLIEENESERSLVLLYTWIYLLRVLEMKEAKHGITIKTEMIYDDYPIIDMILDDWSSISKSSFIKLDGKKQTELRQLLNDRNDLQIKVIKEMDEGKEYAERTKKEWESFLSIINDLAMNERKAVEALFEDAPPKKKISSLNGYDNAVRSIMQEGKYRLGNSEINVLDLYKKILERYRVASQYCLVATSSKEPFRVHYAILSLAMDPRTYNYYVLKYHQFRINPTKDTARRFVVLALESLCKNINIQYSKSASVDEMIEKYCELVESYFEQNKTVIDGLRYDSICTDAISILGFSQDQYVQDLLLEEIKKLYEMEKDGSLDEKLRDDSDAVNDYLNKIDTEIQNNAKARQIIISINMIYLFANAIGIMLTDRHISVIKNKEKAERAKYRLLRIDANIVNKVYADISPDEVGIQEYREKNAIDTMIMSEKERHSAEYYSSVFAETLQSNISLLVKDIETLDIDKLLDTKKRIIEQISSFVLCKEKELYADWVDQICSDICDAMVSICKKQDDDFDRLKQELRSSLGDDAAVLPDETLDSLTTAEILYHRYASQEYSDQGFDYSSISALYYQAFEAAYNTLIWEGYAKKLNETIIDGKPLIEILSKIDKDDFMKNSSLFVYIGKNLKTVKKCIQFKSGNSKLGIDETSFTPYCMYGPFTKVIEKVRKGSEATELCRYFASITGFGDMEEMFNDVKFMDKVKTITASIIGATGNRNNASHGGTYISMDQCTNDKKTVLDNLDEIRRDSLGLIEQLIGIMTYKPSC